MVLQRDVEFVWQPFRRADYAHVGCPTCRRRSRINRWYFKEVLGRLIADVEPKLRCINCRSLGGKLLPMERGELDER